MIYLAADSRKASTSISLCLECEAYSNELERISDEDGCHASKSATDQSPEWRFVGLVGNNSGAKLFVG